MLIIVHGDNLIKSREQLFRLKQQAINKEQTLATLSAKNLKAEQLEQALLAQNLFGNDKLVIVETLHSLAHSKKRTAFIEQIRQASEQQDIILWEKKSLTKSNLKKFPQAKVYHYPSSKALWQLLDQLSPQSKQLNSQLKLLHQAVQQDAAEFCLVMLAGRIGDLLAYQVGAQEQLHPFVKKKLAQQIKKFSLQQLKAAHRQLYQLDAQLKQSQNLLDLAAELDLFLINL